MAVMTAAFLLCSMLVALTTASSSQYYSKHSYSSDSGYDSKPEGVYYGGKYAGSCGQDGIYYNDEYSFVQCAHNIAYMQPCAPGSRNSDSSNMQVGKFYDQAPMCDVNLVDYGYSVFNSRRPSGYGGHGSSGQGSSGYGSSGHGSSGYGSSSYHSGYPSSSSHSG